AASGLRGPAGRRRICQLIRSDERRHPAHAGAQPPHQEHPQHRPGVGEPEPARGPADGGSSARAQQPAGRDGQCRRYIAANRMAAGGAGGHRQGGPGPWRKLRGAGAHFRRGRGDRRGRGHVAQPGPPRTGEQRHEIWRAFHPERHRRHTVDGDRERRRRHLDDVLGRARRTACVPPRATGLRHSADRLRDCAQAWRDGGLPVRSGGFRMDALRPDDGIDRL
ncbi:MAG: Two-component transcriptional response regulator, LuxR family, partial [uncultured Sphingosinicella sp.]